MCTSNHVLCDCRGVPFQAESAMRERGMAKTPDVMLLVPIAVRDGAGGWHIVTWIDSKAMFGYPDAVEEQLPQLLGYVNRYGPGMVLYWFDFVETLNSPEYKHHSKDIYVAKAFPRAQDIMQPDDPEDAAYLEVGDDVSEAGGASQSSSCNGVAACSVVAGGETEAPHGTSGNGAAADAPPLHDHLQM
ncbi:hypothetical protein JKP88DRAFT_207807 [Tribonema minus]|uniref:CDAN1-interacting nuclease 1 n=1 Tax=Tribonema minus TaxID=303371 RepID=A0A836CHL8_9STRA|nr:hypothetical protein JKP88DRAFT_207807 [Tribonema minus]